MRRKLHRTEFIAAVNEAMAARRRQDMLDDFSPKAQKWMRAIAFVLIVLGAVGGIFAAAKVVPQAVRDWLTPAVAALGAVAYYLQGKLPNDKQGDGS